jgi:hypothetical protein
MVYQEGVVKLTSSSKRRGFIAMFMYRKLSFHPVFFSFYRLRQKPTDAVDHYGGARIAYRARLAASITPDLVIERSLARYYVGAA